MSSPPSPGPGPGEQGSGLASNTRHTVYNFVDLNRFRRHQQSPRAHYAEPDQAVLIHISNFRPVKRLQDVVEIFAQVRRRPAVLLMVGDGPSAVWPSSGPGNWGWRRM